MEIELRGQISRQPICPDPFAGSLPAFPRISSRETLQTTRNNDSTAQLIRTTFIENNAMSAAERIPAAETSNKIEYTVRQTAKIHREKQRDSRSSVWLSLAKCIVGIFLFASVLICLVASKISLLSMASFRCDTTNATDTQKKDPKQNQETLFIMTVLVLMIPEGYSFLMACWTSLFSKSRKWPCRKAIIVGLISGLLEVFGLCFFTVVILLQIDIPPDLRIIMMNGVFVFPVLWQVYKKGPFCQEQYSLKQFLVFTLALILEIAGVAVLMYLVSRKSTKIEVWASIPLALLSISFAWCPKIFKIAIEPVPDQLPPGQRQSINESVCIENLSGVSVSLPIGETILGVATSSKSARGKAAVITSLGKLFLIPFVAAFFCYVYQTADLKKLSHGFSDFTINHYAFRYFMVQLFTSFVGYMLGILACSMCMQFLAFAFPMALATPITVLLAVINHDAKDDVLHFRNSDESEILLYVIGICFLSAQFLSVGYYLFKGQDFIMAKESSLFWMPTYNGVLLEQHLLLNRRNKITDDYQINHRELVKNSCVYICTTMYHEIEQEMEQLLQSLHDIDCAREKSKRQIESHIFFDGAIKGDVLNNYVLQLISLIPKTLKVKIDHCMKLKTPYGMQMRWKLPGGMFFHIHLKDNLRVKNKKRWSQVMYMSYVLDFKEKQMEVTDENTYILTTDADVRFTHESVEALLDLMARDPTVGAVCGRTHPLGVGPVVWYQVFDYAIGHWFQKVANHVLGSVLCSPGCFSVYRAAALRDVLPIYSSKVDSPSDFLTKDMGEDRWLCTLMVQSGWRLEYCAAAEDSTYCPDNFDEFFKQRRRWIPSTLANLLLLISEWKLTVNNNDYISFGFILYQALMVFSTIISPSTVILVIATSLSYINVINSTDLLVVLLSLVTVGYALICLYTSQEFQLKVAKLLTVVFSLLMAYVTVGLAAQAADDIYKRQHPPTPTPTAAISTTPHSITLSSSVTFSTATTLPPGDGLPADVSSLYLGGLIGIFIVAALLHPTEASCLLHGVWYLLCLPSGYLLLIVYSICNVTDRSWGTREEKTKKVDDVPWYETLWRKIRYICTCCKPEPATPQPHSDTSGVEGHVTDAASATSGEETSSSDNGLQASEDEGAAPSVLGGDRGKESGADSSVSTDHTTKLLDEAPPKSALKHTPVRRQPSLTREGQKEDSGRFMKFRYPGDKKVTFAAKLPRLNPETLVEDWLQREFQQLYLNNFKDCGYDNVSFIAGMTDRDLKAIGIEKRGHRKRLLIEIEKLPQIEIAQEVPENVEDWLTELGLDEYWENFSQSGYTEPRMLEDLKIMNKETLKETFGIIKPGHLNKMHKAIQRVQYPSEAQRRIRRAREETNKLAVMDIKVDNQDLGHEYQFWEGLRQACLVPESAVFGAVEELKEKLEDLRELILMVFAVANVIWMILILALVKQKNLEVMGTNVLGFSFLCVYGFLIVVQFFTLLWHRGVTFSHVIARAPWRRGQLHRAWAFDDQNLPPHPDDRALQDVRNHRHRRPRRKSKELRRQVSHSSGSGEERESLLTDGRPQSTYGSRSLSKMV